MIKYAENRKINGLLNKTESRNTLSKTFQNIYNDVKEYFFSRNPEYWPVYNDPRIKSIIDYKKLNLSDEDKQKVYHSDKSVFESIKESCQIAKNYTNPLQTDNRILDFTAVFSKDWENPKNTENVIAMASDPGIYGAFIGSVVNSNLVYKDYCQMSAELEKLVVRQIANLAGYDVANSSGFFTQGGTFCNLYGYLLGIRKNMPETLANGFDGADDYRIINSSGGHYSNLTNLSLLGVRDSKIIQLKITDDNNIDIKDLENKFTLCYNLGIKVPAILITMGTTDTFAVDDIYEVYKLNEKLCRVFGIDNPPHIHVDTAVGWPMIFFNEYDFQKNPLEINDAALEGLGKLSQKFKYLKYADSFTVDFQKWGYVPYTSSLFMIKNKKDMDVLKRPPEQFSYFEKSVQGETHLQSTIECSRSATGVFGAYNAMNSMGIEGYQILIAHCLQNASYFKHKLRKLNIAKIVADGNCGPSVGFRLYESNGKNTPEMEFEYELNYVENKEYSQRICRNTIWHRQNYLRRMNMGLFTNWVEFIAHTNYSKSGNFIKIPGEKVVFMNPVTTRKEIDEYIYHLVRSIADYSYRVNNYFV